MVLRFLNAMEGGDGDAGETTPVKFKLEVGVGGSKRSQIHLLGFKEAILKSPL